LKTVCKTVQNTQVKMSSTTLVPHFICTTCNKTFIFEKSFQLHVQKHAKKTTKKKGAKPNILSGGVKGNPKGAKSVLRPVTLYKCPTCQKSFADRDTCEEHKNLHSWVEVMLQDLQQKYAADQSNQAKISTKSLQSHSQKNVGDKMDIKKEQVEILLQDIKKKPLPLPPWLMAPSKQTQMSTKTFQSPAQNNIGEKKGKSLLKHPSDRPAVKKPCIPHLKKPKVQGPKRNKKVVNAKTLSKKEGNVLPKELPINPKVMPNVTSDGIFPDWPTDQIAIKPENFSKTNEPLEILGF